MPPSAAMLLHLAQSNMRPQAAGNDFVDKTLADAILYRQSSCGNEIRIELCPYLKDLGGGKLGAAVRLAARSLLWRQGGAFLEMAPPLQCGVSIIVAECSQEQVRGIAARPVVTPMADAESARVNSVMKKVRHAVGYQMHALARNRTDQNAVAATVDASLPFPALVRRLAGDFAPEKARSLCCMRRDSIMRFSHAVQAPFLSGVVRLVRVLRHSCGPLSFYHESLVRGGVSHA